MGGVQGPRNGDARGGRHKEEGGRRGEARGRPREPAQVLHTPISMQLTNWNLLPWLGKGSCPSCHLLSLHSLRGPAVPKGHCLVGSCPFLGKGKGLAGMGVCREGVKSLTGGGQHCLGGGALRSELSHLVQEVALLSPQGQGRAIYDLLCFYCLGSLPRVSGRRWVGCWGQGGAAGTQCTLCACP